MQTIYLMVKGKTKTFCIETVASSKALKEYKDQGLDVSTDTNNDDINSDKQRQLLAIDAVLSRNGVHDSLMLSGQVLKALY